MWPIRNVKDPVHMPAELTTNEGIYMVSFWAWGPAGRREAKGASYDATRDSLYAGTRLAGAVVLCSSGHISHSAGTR